MHKDIIKKSIIHRVNNISIPIIYQTNRRNNMADYKFEKLSRDSESKTRIMAGHAEFTIEQLEEEINANSEVGRKLKSIEKELDKY